MLHGGRWRVGVAAGLLAGLLLGGNATAWACALDQIPSVSANGQLARLNPLVPTTQAQLNTWTWCLFPHAYAAHHPVVLTEDRHDLARTLMPAALRTPWGWDFGDGQIGYGYTVRHAYAFPGRWRLRVYAYNPESKRWDLFDQVTITIYR